MQAADLYDPVSTVLREEMLAALAASGYTGPAPYVARLDHTAPAVALLYWPTYGPEGVGVDAAAAALDAYGWHGHADSWCVVAVYRTGGDCLACQEHQRRRAITLGTGYDK